MNNIILIGMRGSGKTTVSRLLSDKLNILVINSDEEIEKQEQSTINDLVKEKGWEYFRDKETEFLRKIDTKNQFILSTGGGMILRKENQELLKNIGMRFYLYGRPEILADRLTKDPNKRILITNVKTILDDQINLFNQRKEIYKEAADHVINTETLSAMEVADEIVNIMNKT